MFKGRNYVGGQWGPSSTTITLFNPATEEVYGHIPRATPEEVKLAVETARAAFQCWRHESRVRRADLFDVLAQLLKRDHEKLRDAISVETGKNLNESHAEVIEALHMCQYAASCGRMPYGQAIASELPTKDAMVLRKPRGVIAVISPWNFPLAIGSFWSSAPSIVEGNCVVHKPSELTPMVNQMVAELYEEAGFPPGVYNLIHGDGSTGEALVHDDVDTILFTGSAEVGQLIRQHCSNTWNKTCSIECGSKSATIIFEDGNMALARQVALASAFKLSGQRCVSSSRILVERDIFDQFASSFANEVDQKVVVEGPFNTTCEEDQLGYGPMISMEQMVKVSRFNQMVREDPEARIIVDSDREGTLKQLFDRKGYYLRPFVYMAEWNNEKPYLTQEVFGPHVALIPFDDLDDAIRIYNDTDYGLALGVVTDDFRKHRRLITECRTGMLYINGGSIAAESHLPFGGVGKSGNGHKSAAGTYKAVTDEIAVTVNYEASRMQFAQGMK